MCDIILYWYIIPAITTFILTFLLPSNYRKAMYIVAIIPIVNITVCNLFIMLIVLSVLKILINKFNNDDYRERIS